MQVEKLRIPAEKKNYILENLEPVLEPMVSQILAACPADPIAFMIEYLTNLQRKDSDWQEVEHSEKSAEETAEEAQETAEVEDNFLATVPILSALEPSALAAVSEFFAAENFPAGEVIATQGEAGEKFWILKTGTCKVLSDDLEISQLKGGDYFGEMALIDQGAQAVSVVATSDVEVLSLGREAFWAHLGHLGEQMKARYVE